MGQVIIPTDRKIKGPWILDLKALEELNDVIQIIDEKLNFAYEISVAKEAESSLEDYKKWDKDIDLEDSKEKVKNLFSYRRSEKFVVIHTKQGNKIKDENLISILKGIEINEYNPIELIVHLKKGPCEFTLEITTKYDGELEIRIKAIDDYIFNDINYEINKWINNHKPTVVMQKWFSWFPGAIFLLFPILLISTLIFATTDKDAYRIQLENETNILLNNGLSEKEHLKAIEILLKRESGYVPSTFKQVNKNNEIINYIWLITIISSFILSIKPRTVIGIGKNKWKVNFYKKWVYIVLVFIPLTILLPIIISKLF